MTKKKRMKSKKLINLLTDNEWSFVNKSSEILIKNAIKITEKVYLSEIF